MKPAYVGVYVVIVSMKLMMMIKVEQGNKNEVRDWWIRW